MRLSRDTKEIAAVSVYTVGMYMTAFTVYWLLCSERSYWHEFMTWGGATKHGLGMFHSAMACIMIYGTVVLARSLYKDWKCSRRSSSQGTR